MAVTNVADRPLATQLIADLEQAAGQLRTVQRVPAAAEDFHFPQLDDWREERDVRIALRDAVVSRNADLWVQAAEREVAWRGSTQHARVEAAWQLAARAGY